ncbi:MAG: dihydrolipoyl dehydrogenase [Candidatus Odinarchaeia archaeon]
MVEKFDVIVIGAGSGTAIVERALNEGKSVALIEIDKMGGTCLNRGCIPTKLLIYPADLIKIIEEGKKIGVDAKIENVDVKKIFNRMHEIIEHSSAHSAEAVKKIKNLTWFKEIGEFIDEYSLKVGEKTIVGEKIFIVSGSRPYIPPLEGLNKTKYHTSRTILDIDRMPKSLIIIGGGYIAAEFGHFFSAMGAKVSIIHRRKKILHYLDEDICEIINNELGKRINLLTNREAFKISEGGAERKVYTKNIDTNEEEVFSAEEILLAAGRMPNSDLLKPQVTGVELDRQGFIVVNEYLETSKPNIWAAGDAIGKYMFKHVANYEVEVAWHNATHRDKVKVDYTSIPAAIFTYPQIAQVGLTVKQCNDLGLKILVGSYKYKDVAMGDAMGEPVGIVKVIVNEENGKIMGAHIIGPEASVLIQEIINVMNCHHGSIFTMLKSLHIHPALPEVVQRAFTNLKRV